MNVLDTSAIIDFFRGSKKTLEFMNDEASTSIINYYELLAGVKHKKAKREEMIFRRFLSQIRILDLDLKAAEKASEIMARLMSLGMPVNSMDVLIAGIAVTNGADRLISRDQDFMKISQASDLDVTLY
jgi:hypothetical protein